MTNTTPTAAPVRDNSFATYGMVTGGLLLPLSMTGIGDLFGGALEMVGLATALILSGVGAILSRQRGGLGLSIAGAVLAVVSMSWITVERAVWPLLGALCVLGCVLAVRSATSRG